MTEKILKIIALGVMLIIACLCLDIDKAISLNLSKEVTEFIQFFGLLMIIDFKIFHHDWFIKK